MVDKDLDFEQSPDGSNGSSLADTIKEEFGDEITVTETETDVSIEYPDDYSDEQKLKLQRRIDDFKLDANKLKERNMNVKKLETNLESELERTKRLNDQLEQQLANGGVNNPQPGNNEYQKYWGVESAEDVEDLRTVDPDKYYQGLKRFNEGTVATHSVVSAQAEMQRQAIRNEGHNPVEVEAFAKAHGHTNLSAAYEHFKLKTGKPAPKGVSLPDLQKKQVTLAPKGKGDGRSLSEKEKQAEAEFNSIRT